MEPVVHNIQFGTYSISIRISSNTPPENKSWHRVLGKIVFVAFNAFSIYLRCRLLWPLGFFCGMIWRHAVKQNITDLFGNIVSNSRAALVGIPAAAIAYTLFLPQTIWFGTVCAGADFGSRLALFLEKQFTNAPKESTT